MSLSLKAVERIHERMALSYGAQYARMWAGLDHSALLEMWGSDLVAFASPTGMQRIAWALENLPDRCPNLMEFKSLCRQAPAPAAETLPAPSATPERMRTELAKLGHVVAKPRYTGMMDWAPRILARHAAGERITPTVLKAARDADAIRTRRSE